MKIFHFPRWYFLQSLFYSLQRILSCLQQRSRVFRYSHKVEESSCVTTLSLNLRGNAHQSFMHYPSFVNCILRSLTAYAFFLIIPRSTNFSLKSLKYFKHFFFNDFYFELLQNSCNPKDNGFKYFPTLFYLFFFFLM